MEPEKIYYNKNEYFETPSGNRINKRSLIRGTSKINLNGKTIMMERCIVRGDLAKITLGKYVIL